MVKILIVHPNSCYYFRFNCYRRKKINRKEEISNNIQEKFNNRPQFFVLFNIPEMCLIPS